DSLSIRTLPGGKQLCVVPKPWYDLGGARFSPDGRYLVTRSHNPKRGPHSLRVWDTKKGKLAVEVNSPKLGDAVAFNFSADSRTPADEHHRGVNWRRGRERHSSPIKVRVNGRRWGIVAGKACGKLGREVELTETAGAWFRRHGERLVKLGVAPDGWRLRST